MGQFSVEITALDGTVLSGNQQRTDRQPLLTLYITSAVYRALEGWRDRVKATRRRRAEMGAGARALTQEGSPL